MKHPPAIDRDSPHPLEWLLRLCAVIGIVVLFVLCMKMVRNVSAPDDPLETTLRIGER